MLPGRDSILFRVSTAIGGAFGLRGGPAPRRFGSFRDLGLQTVVTVTGRTLRPLFEIIPRGRLLAGEWKSTVPVVLH